MVNEPPGVRKVGKNSTWAKGTLRLNVNNLGTYINEFIKSISTDDDIFKKGGFTYDRYSETTNIGS